MQLIKEFFAFMEERERIRIRRLNGHSPPWTEDAIFREYSFTNVCRDHDRTTTLLRREFYDVFPKTIVTDPEVLLLNAAIFRYFGTIETARLIGWSPGWSDEVKSRIYGFGAMGMLKFTAAYIVPAAGRSDPKYQIVLDILDKIMERATEVVSRSKWEDAINVLTECYGVGSFMAKEVYLDYIIATGRKPDDWLTWTPTGPGGKRGASVIMHGDAFKISEREALEIIRIVYSRRGEFWPSKILDHDALDLDLTTIQFQCCEFDKYQRVVRGDGKPKRRFHPTIDDVTKAR